MRIPARYITVVAAVASIAIGVLVIAGWILNIPGLTTFLISQVPVRFNLAICFILSGIALLLLNSELLMPRQKRIAQFCAGMVLFIGLFTICQYLFHWNLPVDHLPWKTGPESAEGTYSGRMSPFAALFATLSGIMLLLLRTKKYHRIIQAYLFLAVLVAAMVFISEISGTYVFRQENSPSLLAIVTFIVVSSGAFFSYPLSWLPVSLQQKVTGFFIWIIFFLCFIFFAIYTSNIHTKQTTRLVDHTRNVQLKSQQIVAESQQIVMGTRGFILTGQEEYLAPFNQAVTVIFTSLKELKKIISDNPVQQARADSLEALITQSILLKNQLIQTRREKGLQAAISIVQKGEGEKINGQINDLIASIMQHENRLLDMRKAENQKALENTQRISFFLQICIVLLLLAAWYFIHHNTRIRNKTEIQLREYQHFFNNSNDFSCIANVQGYFEIINPNFRKQLGYSEKELLENQFLSFIHPDDITATVQEMEKLKTGALTINFVNRYRKKDGTYLWLEWHTTPDPDTGKLYAIARDVTERILLEEKLKQLNRDLEKQVEEKSREAIEKEQQYRFLLQNMQEGIQIIGYDWKYLFVNHSVVKQSKYARENLLGYTMMEKYPGIENTPLFKALQDCMTSRRSHTMENEFTFPDGTKEWFELRIQPVPEGLFILSLDITERKRAEEEKNRFLNAVQKSLNEIYLFHPDTLQFLYVNNGALKNLGYTEEEIKKLTPLDLKPDHTAQSFKELVAPLLTGEVEKIVFFTNHKRKNGSLYPVEVHLQLVKQESQTVFLAIILDITERKRAEEKLNEYLNELRESNEQFELVNRATQDTIWVWDFATRQGHWGQGIIKTFGYKEEDLHFDENWLDKYIHPYDREQVRRKLNTAIETGIELWQEEFRFCCADGTYKYVFNRGYIQYDTQGRPSRMYGAMTDITDQKRLEKELAEQQVRQQKLLLEAAIQAQEIERNELGRELHDNINQILATVKMYLGMARSKKIIPADMIDQSFEYVSNAIEEIRKLSHSLVAPSLGDMGLREALQELADGNNQVNGLQVYLQFDEAYYLKDVDKNKDLMLYRIAQEQLNNIVKYARATEAVISVQIENEMLVMSITDNGQGFDPEQKAKGIGLKNIFSRVEFYNGSMNIISAPGKGCMLKVSIPV